MASTNASNTSSEKVINLQEYKQNRKQTTPKNLKFSVGYVYKNVDIDSMFIYIIGEQMIDNVFSPTHIYIGELNTGDITFITDNERDNWKLDAMDNFIGQPK